MNLWEVVIKMTFFSITVVAGLDISHQFGFNIPWAGGLCQCQEVPLKTRGTVLAIDHLSYFCLQALTLK